MKNAYYRIVNLVNSTKQGNFKLFTTLDCPKAFGYKIVWLPIKSKDTCFIADVLGLTDKKESNWESGIKAAYLESHSVFITPPVKGWSFAIDFSLGRFNSDPRDFMILISKKIPDFYYFGNYRVLDYYSWVSAEDGLIKRVYAYYQGTLCDIGEKTLEEKKLGFNFFNNKSEDYESPEEKDVIEIAAAWSLNPLEIDEKSLSKTLGIMGKTKNSSPEVFYINHA